MAAATEAMPALPHARRDRARETTQRLGHTADEAEAYELQETAHGAAALADAGFDPLTTGEHIWMFASAIIVLGITCLGLLMSFGM
ncbi:hypothetical protein MCAP1_002981 [Malassezia caprae]|uniref:Uncharacterized protein n=1 Tax=Malassezia caprae TaxID=1381934 RepID=A0AAF0E9F0_9BASI|nr:hypothetical protein MCAP1_002981 [Malassezia caprae]